MGRRSVNIQIYRNGIKCKFSNDKDLDNETEIDSKRGNVTIFSKKSMQRLACLLCLQARCEN